MTIRKANTDDTRQLLAIYAPYVKQTAITFECDIPTIDDFANRIATISKDYPYIVAEENGKIIGYAYAHQFKGREAYRYSVESTIYLDMDTRHHGIGRQLYGELENQLCKYGYLNMNACIAFQEKADKYLPLDSIHFHKTMGFSLCAHFHKCGYKFGRWYDIVWMEKLIGEHKSIL